MANLQVKVLLLHLLTSAQMSQLGSYNIFYVLEGGAVEKMINILQGWGRILFLSMKLIHSPFLIRNP
jgi:hypothetical protein